MPVSSLSRKSMTKMINGWGADLSPTKRPGVPKEKAPPEGTGAHWSEPERQVPKVKIHKTIERPKLTPVFGTACPPSGLSGRLRDLAYQYGEARLSHWLILLAADRVNVLEGIFEDFVKGRLSNPFSEMGLGVEFKERTRARQIVLGAGIGAIVLGVALSSRRRAA